MRSWRSPQIYARVDFLCSAQPTGLVTTTSLPSRPFFRPPPPPFTLPYTLTRFESGKTDLHNAVWAGHDPVAHTKRLAKLALRIQRESPEEWEELQRVEGLIAKLEGVELR